MPRSKYFIKHAFPRGSLFHIKHNISQYIIFNELNESHLMEETKFNLGVDCRRSQLTTVHIHLWILGLIFIDSLSFPFGKSDSFIKGTLNIEFLREVFGLPTIHYHNIFMSVYIHTILLFSFFLIISRCCIFHFCFWVFHFHNMSY